MEPIKQFDNINERVVDDLHEQIVEGSKLSIAAASFSIYAFEELKSELEQVDEVRFLFTSPTFIGERNTKQKREFFIPKLDRERTLYGSDFEIKLRNQLSQKAIAKECADWIRKKVKFKSNTTDGHINGFINLQTPTEQATYMPFNEFTTNELGCEQGNNLCPGIVRMGAPMSYSYLSNFDELWQDKTRMKDVTDIVIRNIESVYRENAPEFIYFVTLYNIFHEFLDDISTDVLPDEATGFKNSQIWNKLYNFQKDAALAIINKLEQYNGCILADSVGLGKTFTALAVIKYYENRNKSVLVLCPKKLNDNWQTFRGNYLNNPIAKDRLRYDVFFHSDLSRDEGMSNGQNLANINWGNYDLVVIDESHNFRNGGKITTDEEDANPRENRYLRLMNKIIKAGVKTKVLMLSATPVNNRFNDLKNQLQLAYEGDSNNINDKLNTSHTIEDIFRQAQTAYNTWSKLPAEERTTERLLGDLDFDFFEVLDAVTIARSRKHIEQYYDMQDIGKFPNRLPPISQRPPLTELNRAISFSEIAQQLNELNLALYAPSFYLLPSKRYKYGFDDEDIERGLSMAGREKGIRKLMAINMLKRLESSVNSFRLTIGRIKEQIDTFIEKIEDYQKNGGDTKLDLVDITDGNFDIEESDNELLVGGKKTNIALSDMDYLSWKRDLQADKEIFEMLLVMLKVITPEHDSKLQLLIENLRDKFAHPINGNNKKVIIFTAFSDTAKYLYEQLANAIWDKHHLYTGLVTGDETKTNMPNMAADFNKILTLFSPISKERDVLLPKEKRDIDILIATDCISEGQNLQDCDYLINYDIHWNPVRIIQRFGRIDRIGSQNEVIQLVNYWPDIELDEYISLKGRVESRMKATILTATGDDNLLSNEEKGDLDYRRQQLKRLQEEVVDLEDMDTGINIMDLGLNEFRLDLLSYMHDNPDVEHTPNGLHAVVAARDNAPQGVVFVLKNRNNGVNIDRKNLLHPFYMVYLRNDGEVEVNHLQPKQLLDRLRMLCKGQCNPLHELCSMFNSETLDGRKMGRYSNMLGEAIRSIISVKDTSDMDSFLSGVQTDLFVNKVSGLDDFELICFFVVK